MEVEEGNLVGYDQDFSFFFFFLKKMRVKLSVKMAFKFYKISSEPLHLQ